MIAIDDYIDNPSYRLDKSECDPDSGFLTSSNYELLTFINYNNNNNNNNN